MNRNSRRGGLFAQWACTAAVLMMAAGAYAQGSQVYGSGVSLKLDDEGQKSIRFITWHQVWSRVTEYNPGTQVQGMNEDSGTDFGLRRSRLVIIGNLTDRVQILTHFGINNQTFNSGKKPTTFVHDAWVNYKIVDKYLHLGTGLHYWNGLSRMTNASTLNLLSLDAPIVNWPTIERTDQFARQFGVFAKGKAGRLDYRASVNRPFAVETEAVVGRADDSAQANSLQYNGYFQWQFADIESNAVPFTVGSYLGSKTVFNLGAGFIYRDAATWSLDAGGDQQNHDMLLSAVDAYADIPLGNGSAFTGYLVFYNYDFGPNYLRNVGIMNVGSGGTSANGPGNAQPTIGTGQHIYGQLGYLLPHFGGDAPQVQPYVTALYQRFDALADPATTFEAGTNLLLIGHHAKLTLNYRNRPVFEAQEASGAEPVAAGRAEELILQSMVYF